MRSVRHFVATSLDAYIAGPNGEVDWLFSDQDYGLKEFMDSVDTVLLGRKTYEFGLEHGMSSYPGVDNYVFSRTLDPAEHSNVNVVADDVADTVNELKSKDGKAIWLVGGGQLFRRLLDANLIDELIVAVHPILLGRGIPLLPERTELTHLHLLRVKPYDTGLVTMSYVMKRS